jgi:hypothetical protein
MMEEREHPALSRVLNVPGGEDLMRLLSEGLSGSDLTTLLLAVARRRAASLRPSDVLAQYQRDRFVAPAGVDLHQLRRVEELALEAVAPSFTPVVTAPVVPLGTHSVLAGVNQNRVISTIRSTEVAADPTNALALEAAVLRRRVLDHDPRSREAVRLCAIQRIVRGQRFDAPRSFAHFSLLGLVSAGRDRGAARFETAAMLEHVQALVVVARGAGADRVVVRITDFAGRRARVIDMLHEQLAADAVKVDAWPERTEGRGYYSDLAFKLLGRWGGEELEVGDGGVVDWTQLLLQNRKERLVISGLSLERLAVVVHETDGPAPRSSSTPV